MNFRGRNWIAALLAVGLLAATVYALTRGTLPPAEYTFINGTEVKSLDPHSVNGVPEGRIVAEIFEGLCRWNAETLEPEPGVAESWEISDDGTVYTFSLRKNAKWSDGTPVTADDFIWSFRRFLHPATAAEYAYEMWYAKNGEKFTSGQVEIGDSVEVELIDRAPNALPHAAGELVKGTLTKIEDPTSGGEKTYTVEIDGRPRRFCKGGGDDAEDYRWLLIDFDSVGISAPDAHTVRFELNHPVPYFLHLMGFYPMFPVNRTCVETHGWPDWIRPENIVSNGPFRLSNRRVRDRVRLVKSDTYWDRGKVRLESIDALAVESETTGLNMYLTGQVDYAEPVPATIVRQMVADDRPDFDPSPYIATYMYRLNVTHKPLDDVRVRRALGLAIDKQAIVEHVTKAGQIPARSVVPPVLEKYVPYKPAFCEERNIQKARKLLAEAGYPDGEGFPKIELTLDDKELHKAIAQVVQSQWKENLGIDVGLRTMEWSAYQAASRRLEYDIGRYGWVGDYPDPHTFLKMWVTGGGNNQTGWSNEQYDRLIDLAQKEADQDKRLAYYHQAEQILMDEMPIIPMYYYVSAYMSPPYVHGVYGNVHNFHPLKEVWIDHEHKKRFDPMTPIATSASAAATGSQPAAGQRVGKRKTAAEGAEPVNPSG